MTEAHLAAELARSQQDLARLEAQCKQLTYAVSHDLMAHIRHLTGFLGLLDESNAARLDDTGREFLGFCRDAAQRLDAMAGGLLVYSRIGRKEAPFEAVDLRKAVAEARDQLADAVADLDVQANGLPTVQAEPKQMVDLWRHLLDNAAKFRHPDRTPCVRITAQVTPTGHRILVEDNGIGMPAKDAERIFEMFTQLQARGTIAGNGVGLALVRRIVERHGGKVGVQSSDEAGTKFFIDLPSGKST